MKFSLSQSVRVKTGSLRGRRGIVRQLRADGTAFVEMEKPLPQGFMKMPLFPRAPERGRWVILKAEDCDAV